jgi:predicted hotdog family 3-hydroxylacyl-ACP dehydratase
MLLLRELATHDERSVEAWLEIGPQMPFFDVRKGAPSWILIEGFAQTAAVLGGLGARQKGEAAPRGFLLGTRRFDCDRGWLVDGSRLRLRAELAFEDGSGMAAYECQIVEGPVQARCTLNVYVPGTGRERNRPS